MIGVLRLYRKMVRANFPSGLVLADDVGRPALVEERIPARYARLVGRAAASAVFVAIAWAAFASIDEVSVATGALIPQDFEQTLQHLEGGIVQDIHVREGDVIEKDTILLTLRDASTLEDGETLERQRMDLKGQLETQRALADQRDPDFTFISNNFAMERINNLNAYNAAMFSLMAQRREFDSQISEARFSLDAVRAQLTGAREEQSHAIKEEQRYRKLFTKGVVTEVQYAEKRRLRLRADAELAALLGREGAAIARSEEVEHQKASFEAAQKAVIAQRVLEIEAALTALEGTIRKKNGRRQRLSVKAPIRGVVKSLQVKGAGAVVEPGEDLAVIVPLDKPLLAETKVPARQVGYLKTGQTAHVKVSAFDYTRYGWLDGHIKSISPSSFQSTDGRSYYLVRLQLENQRLKKAPGALLLPGMEVTADIITGQKTALQYLLTPLQRTLTSAFGER
ncbi:HlyD family type I secretion periplasmic adaptor subunit [Roseibium sp.]|uniref:HlyD family type I secretion periplasmic adaptor subunit n=1 Tax=Roseibium sp. TaxID=1936156 RepID=UPI003D141F97